MERDQDRLANSGKRRAAVREALYETVVAFTALSDTPTLISRVCKDVRRALSCDLTYLATLDESGERIVARTASGESAVRFSSVRTDRGVGIAGLVLATGRVFSTSNYWRDFEIQHDSDVDDIIRREGLTAFAAAPLVAEGKVFGALLAADRQERHFTQFDLDLLGEIASVVGPAHRRASLEETRAQDLDSSQSELRAAIAFRNTALTATRATLNDDASPETRKAVLAALTENFGIEATLTSPKSDDAIEGFEVYRREVPNSGRVASHLTATVPRPEANEWLEAAIESTSLSLGVAKQLEDSFAASDERARGEMLQDLTLSRPLRHLRDRAVRLGVEALLDRAVAMVLLPDDPHRRGLRSLKVMALLKEYGGLAEDQGTRIVVLLPADDAEPRCNSLAKTFFSETGGGYAARSMSGTLGSYSKLIEDATLLALASKNIGADRFVADETRLGFVGSALSSRGANGEAIVEQQLGPVIAYDEERGTELVATMRSYVSHNQNARSAARDLVVHPKTVAQRLARISSLLGEDWILYPRYLGIATALEVHAVMESAASLRLHP